MDELNLNQFKEIFCSEAKEHLATMNASLLQLEKAPQDLDLLNEIFRAAHTLKGMAATVGFDKITQLTHEMENILDKLRKGKLVATEDTVELLFSCFDTLEALVDEASAGEDKGINVAPLLERLRPIAQKTAEETPAEKPAAASPAPAPAPAAAPSPAAPAEAPAPAQAPSEPVAGQQPAPAATPEPAPQAAPVPKAAETNPAHAVHEEKIPVSDSGEVVIDKIKTQAVRIKIEYLDRLMNLVGELVINGARLQQIAQDYKIAELSAALAQFERTSIDLQEEVLKTRMVPVRHIFDRYPRMVRDLTKRLNKEIEFQIIGSEIEIDRSLLEEINEPLVHLLRNAVDHGIESPAARKKAGKPSSGLIKLTARRERGYAVIEVKDDGKGMSPDELRQKAIEKGIITVEESKSLSENEIFMLICHPSFSMAAEVTDISGRGVGMDAVRHLVESFNGKLEIRSKKGEGSTFILQLPLTLAIIQALLVRVSKEIYAVPLTSVSEIANIDMDAVKTVGKREFMMLRNEVIPLVRLNEVFGVDKTSSVPLSANYAVIVEISGKKTGLVVSSLIGQQQIVIKTLTGILRHTKSFSGATILGDGRVIMIIDVTTLYG